MNGQRNGKFNTALPMKKMQWKWCPPLSTKDWKIITHDELLKKEPNMKYKIRVKTLWEIVKSVRLTPQSFGALGPDGWNIREENLEPNKVFITTKSGKLFVDKNWHIPEWAVEVLEEIPEFRPGEVVESSSNGKYWDRATYISLTDRVDFPHKCLNDHGKCALYRYVRKPVAPRTVTMKEVCEKFGEEVQIKKED